MNTISSSKSGNKFKVSRFLKKSTVSRKILLVVFGSFLFSLSLLVYISSQNQRSDIQELAFDNYETVSKLLAVQMSGGLKWKKVIKITEVYDEISLKEGSVLAEVRTFDKSGEQVTQFQSKILPNGDLVDAYKKVQEKLNDNDVFTIDDAQNHVVIVPVKTAKGEFVGTAAFAWSLQDLEAQLFSNLLKQLVLAGAVMAGLMVLTGILLNRFIGAPLTGLTKAMMDLAGGERKLEIVGLERADDLGDMSRAVQVFKENADKVDALQAENEREASRKAAMEEQLRSAEMEKQQAEIERQRQSEEAARESRTNFATELAAKLEASVNAISQKISKSAVDMKQQAQTMVDSAENTDQHSSSIASASEQAAQNVSGVASAAEELSASLQEIGRQVTVSSNLTEETLKETEVTDSVVSELADTAGQIGNVLNLINEIAAQTNLLALNATIEAARAGDAGKGFAVVASEVKGLASQTTKATEEISRQIDQMQSASTNAVGAVQGIKGMIVRINETVQMMESAVHEQNTATLEITKNVQMASERTGEVSKSVSDVSNMASISGEAAGKLLESVGELSEQSSTLETEVDAVLKEIRSMV